MSRLVVKARARTYALKDPFTISRGKKREVEVVECAVTDGTHVGIGEATPIYYEGEDAALCIEAIEMRGASRVPLTRASLLETMMEGAARNALDCALWDLEAKQTGRAVWDLAGLPAPKPLPTLMTLSLDTPQAMAAAAQRATAKGFKLLKLKLDGEDDVRRVAAVREAVDAARLIIDLNESWDGRDVAREAHALARFGVELIEQPVAAGSEEDLDDSRAAIPLCADESCHTADDLARCAGRYQAINIKLDKAGGLTAAMMLATAARAQGFKIMLGCMLGSALGLRPAFALAQTADWADIDGALWLDHDDDKGFTARDGLISDTW